MADKTQELDETLLNLDNDNGMILGVKDDELIPIDPSGPTSKYSEYDTCYVNVRYYYILNDSSNWQPTGSSQDINLIENAGICYGGMYVSGSYTDLGDSEATWNSDYSCNHFFDTSTDVLKTSTKDTYLYCCFVVRRYGSHSVAGVLGINDYTTSGISVDVSIGTVHRCTSDSSIDAVKFSYCYGPDASGGAAATIEEYSTVSGTTSTICRNINGSYSTASTSSNIKIKNASGDTFIDANKRTSLSGLTWTGSDHQYYDSANVSLYVYKIAHINFIYNNTQAAAVNYVNPPSIKYYPALCVHAAQVKSNYSNLIGSGTYKTVYTWGNLRPDPNATGLTTANAYITIEYEANPGNFSHKFFIDSDASIQSKVKMLYTRPGNSTEYSITTWPNTNWTIDNSNTKIKLTTDLNPSYWGADNDWTLIGKDASVLSESFVYINRNNINTNSYITIGLENLSPASGNGLIFMGADNSAVDLFQFTSDSSFNKLPSLHPGITQVEFYTEYLNNFYYYCPHVSCEFGSYVYNDYTDTNDHFTYKSYAHNTKIPLSIYYTQNGTYTIDFIDNFVQYNEPLTDASISTQLNFWLNKASTSIASSYDTSNGISCPIYTFSLSVADIISTPNNIVYDCPYMKSYAIYTNIQSSNYDSRPDIGISKSICYIVHFIISGNGESSKQVMSLQSACNNLITSSNVFDDMQIIDGTNTNPFYDISEYFTFNKLIQNCSFTGTHHDYYNDFDYNLSDKFDNVVTPKQLMSSTMWCFVNNDSFDLNNLTTEYGFRNILCLDYKTGIPVGSLSMSQTMNNLNNPYGDLESLDITEENQHSWLDMASVMPEYNLAAVLFGTGNENKVINEHQYILFCARQTIGADDISFDASDRYIDYSKATALYQESSMITCNDRDISYSGFQTWWSNYSTKYPVFAIANN